MLIAWILQKPFVPLLRSRVTDKTPKTLAKMTIAQQLKIKKFPFIIKDDQGNEVYFEISNGYWYKQEYDERGNRVYYEDSNGYWTKREYDDQGNQVYLEDSNGYWTKREYDDQGNQVYFEDSNGQIVDNRAS